VNDELSQASGGLAGQVYAKLRMQILSGELTQGTLLREVAVSERFGVSRTPVREALKRLTLDRLLERSSVGLVVRGPTHEEVVQSFEAWQLLEGAAAEQACVRRDQADLAVLEGVLARHAKQLNSGSAHREEIQLEFHEQLWRASHNSVLIDLLQRLHPRLVFTATTTLADEERWTVSVAEHEALVAAVRSGDAKEAGALARAHIADALDARLLSWRNV
jgi:DNA-binding GntR family transcriptional regulator